MSVKLFLSDTLDKATRSVYEKLASDRSQKGKKIIICPDRFTLSTEKNLMKNLKIAGSFDIEVMSFSRLAKKTLANTNKYLSPEAAVLMMRRAIDKVSDKFVYYGNAAKRTGFASEIYAAISAIRNNGISPEQLREKQEKLSDTIKPKMEDVIKIYESYLSLLDQSNSDDMTTALEGLIKEIPESAEIHDTDFYIIEFFSCTGVQLNIIKSLMKHAKSVTIGAVVGGGNANAYIYPSKYTGPLIDYTISLVGADGRSYIPDELSEQNESIIRNLWGYVGENTKKLPNEKTEIYAAKTRIEEVTHVASLIRQAVIKEGARYSDMAIVCGNQEYKRLFDEVFPEFEIPYFADVKTQLISHFGARFILSWLKADGNFSRENVFEFVKNPLFGETMSDADLFENYCLEKNIDHTSFTRQFETPTSSNGYYNDYEFKKDVARTETAENIRKKFLSFAFKTQGEQDYSSFIKAIREFIKETDLARKLEDFTARQEDIGDVRNKEITAQVMEKIEEVLEVCNVFCGDVVAKKDDFIVVLSSILDATTISTVPYYLDCVYAGDLKESRYSDVKYLFFMGANDGDVPLLGSDGGILSEHELSEYRKLNVNIEPDMFTAYNEEKLTVTQVLTKPSKKLFVSYSLTQANGSPIAPSKLIEELTRLFEVPVFSHHNYLQTHPDFLPYFLGTKKHALALLKDEALSLPENVKEYLSQNVRSFEVSPTPTSLDLTQDDCFKKTKQKLENGDVNENYYTKVSQLESYFVCPYKHYAQYILGLKERKEGVKVADFGNFVHEILDRLFKKWKTYASVDEAKADVDHLIKEVASEKYGKKLDLSIEKYIIDAKKIVYDVVERQNHTSFEVMATEKAFGKGNDDFKPIKIADLDVNGKIDRIDTLSSNGKNYAAVIDYKTGNVESDFASLYYGEKIQTYVYMKALKESGFEPAAALYYDLKCKIKKDEPSKNQKLLGQIVKDEEIVDSLDRTVKENYELKIKDDAEKIKTNQQNGKSPYPGNYIKAAYNSKLELVGTPRDNYTLISPETFDGFMNYAIAVSEGAIKEIKEGYFTPSPLENKCKYCVYKDMCEQIKTKERETTTVSDASVITNVMNPTQENPVQEEGK